MADGPAAAYHRRMSNACKDKVALVTGGSRGIGHAVAEALLEEGAKVFICGRDPDTVKARSEGSPLSIGATGSTARRRMSAVTRSAAPLVAAAAERFGGLDILVNNAGIGIFKPIDQFSPEEWAATIETNLSSVFYCSREAIPLMRRRGGGYIFNVSSLAAVNAFAGGGAYNASKFGLNGLTEAMMLDVRYDGIRVSTIMPGKRRHRLRRGSGNKAEGSVEIVRRGHRPGRHRSVQLSARLDGEPHRVAPFPAAKKVGAP